jgi:serine/threonine protein kinase HipA of HipAB toxin-antitoxin module
MKVAQAWPSAPQILQMLDCVIFNAFVGNHDAQAKNFSLLYSGKAFVLGPTITYFRSPYIQRSRPR